MGPDAHKDIAVAVAEAAGIEDRQVLVFASVYPDVKNRENSEDFRKCEELGIWHSKDRFPSKHHSRERAGDIKFWLGSARRHYLGGEPSQCDKCLGIALHFIADAMSPYGATKGEQEQHQQFERKCKEHLKLETFEGVSIEEIAPHSAVEHIEKKVRAGWVHGEGLHQVSLFLREVYRLCLQAAVAVHAPMRYQPSEKKIQEAKREEQARLEELREDEKADHRLVSRISEAKDEARKATAVRKQRLEEQMRSVSSSLGEMQNEIEEVRHRVTPALEELGWRPPRCLVYAMVAMLSVVVLPPVGYACYSYYADPLHASLVGALVAAAAGLIWVFGGAQAAGRALADWIHGRRERRVREPLTRAERRKEGVLEEAKDTQRRYRADCERIEAKKQRKIAAAKAPYDRTRNKITKECQQKIERVREGTSNWEWYLRPST